MKDYTVQYAAIYYVTATVKANDEDDAIRMIRAEEWEDIIDTEYDRPHPETEYHVEEDPYG